MKLISLLEFRKNSKKIFERAKHGERMIITYRGKPMCRIEPVENKVPDEDDPFYQIDRLAESKTGHLNNAQMDKIIYGL